MFGAMRRSNSAFARLIGWSARVQNEKRNRSSSHSKRRKWMMSLRRRPSPKSTNGRVRVAKNQRTRALKYNLLFGFSTVQRDSGSRSGNPEEGTRIGSNFPLIRE